APWVAELDTHERTQADAVRLLRAMRPDLVDVVFTVNGGMLHVTGRAIAPDAAVVAALGPAFAIVPPLPSLPEIASCKGDLLGADIKLCPELGLNVHGKALYVVPYTATDIRTITGHNVHRNFLDFVAARWADYQSRQSPGADAVTVTLGGTLVAL